MAGRNRNPWENTGGGCLVGAPCDDKPPCDDEYEHTETGARVNLSTTHEAHFGGLDSPPHGIPLDTKIDDLPAFVAATPGVEFMSPKDEALARAQPNPYRNPLKTWHKVAIGVSVIAVVGLGFAGVARAAGRRSTTAKLREAVEREVEGRPKASVTTLTDAVYAQVLTECPRKLDPRNPKHRPCIELWLEIREMVREFRPEAPESPIHPGPPSQPGSEEPQGPVLSGPAADMRAWFASLTPEQRAGVEEIVGSQYVGPLEAAADTGDDEGTVEAALAIKNAAEQLYETDKWAAVQQGMALKRLLGPKADELISLAKSYEHLA